MQRSSSIYLKRDSRRQATVPMFSVLHNPFRSEEQKLYNLFSIVQTGRIHMFDLVSFQEIISKCLSEVYPDSLDLEVRQET